MYFILTTKDEEELQPFLKTESYKYTDVNKLQRDFDASIRERTTIYYDYHLNEYITKKLFNSFKNDRSHYFIYRLNSYDTKTIENIYNFVMEKHKGKFEQLIVVGDAVDKKTMKTYESIGVDHMDIKS